MSLTIKIIVALLVILTGLLLGGSYSFFRMRQLEARLFPPTDPATGHYITL